MRMVLQLLANEGKSAKQVKLTQETKTLYDEIKKQK